MMNPVAKAMNDLESYLQIIIPQARLINSPDSTRDFEVEYTPDPDSYWYGGTYLFSFHFPDDYPLIPPKVMCQTKIYHPNIDYDGNVCLDMLKDDWRPAYTGMTFVGSVYLLFIEPNPNDPLNHDAAKIMRDNIEQFKENVKETLKGGNHFNQDFPSFT